jgi:hypothetical protein
MRLNLAGAIASNIAVDETDVLNTKRALNRLGFYAPDPRVGLHAFPDGRLFTAIKAVQQAHNLIVDGKIGLNSATLALINTLLGQAENKGSYVWKTVEDASVRPSHAARHGEVFEWKDDPTPGSEPHCRCWAENVRTVDDIVDPPIQPVYPELILLPGLKAGQMGSKIIGNLIKRLGETKEKSDTMTSHGKLRSTQRNISEKDIKDAISSAEKSGNTEHHRTCILARMV